MRPGRNCALRDIDHGSPREGGHLILIEAEQIFKDFGIMRAARRRSALVTGLGRAEFQRETGSLQAGKLAECRVRNSINHAARFEVRPIEQVVDVLDRAGDDAIRFQQRDGVFRSAGLRPFRDNGVDLVVVFDPPLHPSPVRMVAEVFAAD